MTSEQLMTCDFWDLRKVLVDSFRAVEAGADFLAESFTFMVALSLLLLEQYRARRQAAKRKEFVDISLQELEQSHDQIEHLMQDVKAIRVTLDSLKEQNLLLAEGLQRIMQAEEMHKAVAERLDKVVGLQNIFDDTTAPKQLVINIEPGTATRPGRSGDDDFLKRLNNALGIRTSSTVDKEGARKELERTEEVVTQLIG